MHNARHVVCGIYATIYKYIYVERDEHVQCSLPVNAPTPLGVIGRMKRARTFRTRFTIYIRFSMCIHTSIWYIPTYMCKYMRSRNVILWLPVVWFLFEITQVYYIYNILYGTQVPRYDDIRTCVKSIFCREYIIIIIILLQRQNPISNVIVFHATTVFLK